MTPDIAADTLNTLAADGWRLIIVAAPGLRAAAEAAAAERTGTTFLLVGDREATEVATRDGALEAVCSLAGRAAGARAAADGVPVIGYVARGADPREEGFRAAAARGVRETCPACEVRLRRTAPDAGPGEDADAVRGLFDAGADVVFAGTGGDAALDAVPPGRWLVARALAGPCAAAPDRCLTATFWQWDLVYDSAVKRVNDGTWQPRQEVLGPESGAVGLLGFMDREAPPQGIPVEAMADLRVRFDRMKHRGGGGP